MDRIHRFGRARTVAWLRRRTTTRVKCTWTPWRESPQSIRSSSVAGTSLSRGCARYSTPLPNASNGLAAVLLAAPLVLPAARRRAVTLLPLPKCRVRQLGSSSIVSLLHLSAAPSSIRTACTTRWKVPSCRGSAARCSKPSSSARASWRTARCVTIGFPGSRTYRPSRSSCSTVPICHPQAPEKHQSSASRQRSAPRSAPSATSIPHCR